MRICNLAEDKRVAIRIVLFHKQQTVDGGMEAMNPAFRLVNQNVLSHTPCSVGILVDRGLSGAGSRMAATNQFFNKVACYSLAVWTIVKRCHTRGGCQSIQECLSP
ncbi:Cation/H(+) antiporter 15 [Linum perenne]